MLTVTACGLSTEIGKRLEWKSPTPCSTRIETRDSAVLFPTDIVHPRTHEPRLWDVFGHGLCVTRYAV